MVHDLMVLLLLIVPRDLNDIEWESWPGGRQQLDKPTLMHVAYCYLSRMEADNLYVSLSFLGHLHYSEMFGRI
jgi:hypothetical protein